ncbi:DUF4097 family beta strand repeat-containing protein [Planococcus sp. X10-3]|uniref:DUF4097 family beta strand repeat-containing protein n=1 Tax=Planococcus sp. X10-3 TaxID=3061240 RepID=UPI003BAF1262
MKIFVRVLIIVTVLIVIGVIAVLYAIYNSDSGQQDVQDEQTFDEEIEDVEIEVDNARVEILPSDDDTTRITMTGNNDDFTLETDISGSRLQIEVEDRSPFFNFGFNRSYSLQVYIPENGLASLTVNSDNGAIHAENIGADEISIEADNGRIELEAVDSDTVNIETDNGRIELRDMDANISTRSSNGRIIFTGVSGELLARANNGRIELTTVILDSPVDFETDNGSIEIRTVNEPDNARIEADIDNGSINLYGQDTRQLSFGNGDVLIRLVSNNGRIVVE